MRWFFEDNPRRSQPCDASNRAEAGNGVECIAFQNFVDGIVVCEHPLALTRGGNSSSTVSRLAGGAATQRPVVGSTTPWLGEEGGGVMRYSNWSTVVVAMLVLIAQCGVASAQTVNLAPSRPTIYNYEYGYIDPYYPRFSAPTVEIPRPSFYGDYHEGWVSKYLYDRPTVSPYLNLLRHDIYFYKSTNYHALVRPALEARYPLGNPTRTVKLFHFDPATGQGAVRQRSASDRGLLTTGHPTHFMSHLHRQSMVAVPSRSHGIRPLQFSTPATSSKVSRIVAKPRTNRSARYPTYSMNLAPYQRAATLRR